MTRRRILQLWLVAAALGQTTTATAARQSKVSKGGVDKQGAAAAARRATGGTVLAVRRKGDVYRVRILTPSGRVTTVQVDADSGRVKRR